VRWAQLHRTLSRKGNRRMSMRALLAGFFFLLLWPVSAQELSGTARAKIDPWIDARLEKVERQSVLVGDDGEGNQIGVAPGAKWIACRSMDHGLGSPSTYLDCWPVGSPAIPGWTRIFPCRVSVPTISCVPRTPAETESGAATLQEMPAPTRPAISIPDFQGNS